jgi:hypothetical protein
VVLERCWRGAGEMLKISSAKHVKNKEVLLRIKEERNILHAVTKGKLTGLVTYKLLSDTRYLR